MADFFERLVELLKEDKELHDAAVQFLLSSAHLKEEMAIDRRLKRERMK